MRRYRSSASELSNHPFRSMFDLMLALLFFLILVIIMMVPKNRYLDFITAEDFVRQQVNRNVSQEYRPSYIPARVKRDPIGRQRWVYTDDPTAPPKDRFFADTVRTGIDSASVTLTQKGTEAIKALAAVLRQYGPLSGKQKWYRIDIEGHTGAVPGEVEPWEKSTSMAITVARLLESQGLPAYVLKVSGRGRQDEGVISGERVEIIVEYSNTTDDYSDSNDL